MSSDKKTILKSLFSFDFTKNNFFKKYAQIIYAVILMLFIPAIIIGSNLIIINKFQKNIDQQLLRQGEIITALLDANFNEKSSQAEIQNTIDKLSLLSQSENALELDLLELQSIDVMKPKGDKFEIIASHFPENINKEVGESDTIFGGVNNFLAWHKDRGISHKTRPSNEDVVQFPELRGQRYLNMVFPIHSDSGEKIALINMKMSFQFVDDITQETLWTSFAILLAILVVIILLLLINTRLFGYAFMVNKLKEVDQMKDEFISMASHELRTPITAIHGYISMFVDGSFGTISEAGNKGINIIDQSIKRLAALVEDLLNVSRIEQGRLEYKLESVKLNEVIDATIAELIVKADEKKLHLEYDKPAEDYQVQVDKDRLHQVMVNIIGNSIKYTEEGSITIRVEDADKQIKVRIKDTGIGMNAKAREQLFTKFYRVKTEKTQKIVGTGLGLWITKQIIEQMGGEIYVDSIEGSGSEFSFTLNKANKIDK